MTGQRVVGRPEQLTGQLGAGHETTVSGFSSSGPTLVGEGTSCFGAGGLSGSLSLPVPPASSAVVKRRAGAGASPAYYRTGALARWGGGRSSGRVSRNPRASHPQCGRARTRRPSSWIAGKTMDQPSTLRRASAPGRSVGKRCNAAAAGWPGLNALLAVGGPAVFCGLFVVHRYKCTVPAAQLGCWEEKKKRKQWGPVASGIGRRTGWGRDKDEGRQESPESQQGRKQGGGREGGKVPTPRERLCRFRCRSVQGSSKKG